MSELNETYQKISAKGRVQKQANKYIGLQVETNNCGKCIIIDYENCDKVKVRFIEPEYEKFCQLGTLVRGGVTNPYFPSVFGKGFIGVGKYTSKDKRVYRLWKAMLGRCYNPNIPESIKTYSDVTVCDEWLNFQNFATWCNSQKFFNAKDNQGNSYQLDKDILVEGNKVYSPDTCCFVPQEINNLVSCKTGKSGKTGVFYKEKYKKFSAQVKLGEQGLKLLGSFETESEAFQAYKVVKESCVKQIAEKWRDVICEKSYKSLMKWSVL